MTKLTQTTRHIAIDTPLGADVLLLQRFSGHEKISSMFKFDLNLISEDYEIKFDDIIGQNVTISMELPGGGKRYWNGFISRFEQGASTSRKFAQYEATMVSWLWFLTLTSDCRIFQKKTVPDIIKQVFNDLGFSDVEDRLSPGYRKWIYCVQYRETHFHFVSRLMEQEGIYYYFLHEDGKCTLVLCDSLSKHDTYDTYNEIKYMPDTKHSAIQERISDWAVVKQVLTGKFAHTDYNFEKPSTSLMSTEEDQKKHPRADYEIYDYPGEYPEKSDGDKYAKVRMEELTTAHEVGTGESESRGLCSGYTFNMSKHTRIDQNREYLILSTDYQAAAEDYETSGGQNEMCSCFFTAVPSSVQYRQERNTPKPVIQGTQTAVVTGPPGEEIYPDQYGRIKVQFHWDRQGKYDENSSCWIRVSQVHAGKGFGGIDIPRIGEEVIVSFMEGDPDQPVITGRVYNAELMPPFGLPDQKVVSGMKSMSTPGGGGYNEISLNDTKGKEGLTVHAQYNMDTAVENDQSTVVHNNRTIAVDVNDTETVGSNQNINIGADQTINVGSKQKTTIGSSRTLNIGVDDSIAVGAKRTESVGADHKLSVGGSQTIAVSGAIKISSDTSITLTVGGSTVKIEPAGVSIKSTQITIEGVAKVETKGAMISSQASGINEIKGGMVKLN